MPFQAMHAAHLPRDHAAPEPTLALTKASSALASAECGLRLVLATQTHSSIT